METQKQNPANSQVSGNQKNNQGLEHSQTANSKQDPPINHKLSPDVPTITEGGSSED